MSKELVYKRKGSPYWYVAGTRESTRTTIRKRAEEAARKSLELRWRREQLGEVMRSWDDLVADWLEAKEHKATIDKDKQIARYFGHFLRQHKVDLLVDVTSDLVSDYLRWRKNSTSPSTANRDINTLKAMFRRAHLKDTPWVTRMPKFEAFQLVEPEIKPVPTDALERICAHLSKMDSDIAKVLVMTGMRSSNACGLQWSWINDAMTVITLPAVDTKAKRTYTAVIPSPCRELLISLKNDSPYVFPDGDGHRDSGLMANAWNRARFKADLLHVRRHDLRHTFAAAHIKNGTPDRALQAMLGHSSAKLLQRYARFSTEHLESFADNAIIK